MSLLIAFLAITGYLACSLMLMLRLRRAPLLKNLSTGSILVPGFAGLIAHISILYTSMMSPEGINLGFFTALSLVGAFIVLFSLVSTLRHPVEILGVVVMPVAAVLLAADISTAGTHMLAPGSPVGLIFHVVMSLIAYSLLGLAAIHAIILSVQNTMLHRHQPGGVIRLLPPLKTMENLLFDTILIGFVCLSISLASGIAFLENMFEQQVAHKTVLSIIAWIVFAILLGGRWIYGWRGKQATRWTLGGFISLMLAYFGSKFVLEYLLASG